tara:strand:+ start:756 stop:1265 length:510 start_codon:yes stop_codon:yes gene_type:complete
MRLGIKFNCLIIILLIFSNYQSNAEDRITSTPLLNLDKIKPSYESLDQKEENSVNKKSIKKKIKKDKISNKPHAILIGLDKITAKSSKIIINVKDSKKFGPLEIKILKCGKTKRNNKIENIAYMQVKDVSKKDNDTVFIFNGWTFSSDPNITPFDHAIYDLQLINCNNV